MSSLGHNKLKVNYYVSLNQPFGRACFRHQIFVGDIFMFSMMDISLRWRRNGRSSVLNHQPHDCLLNRLFRRRSTKTSKLRVTHWPLWFVLLCLQNRIFSSPSANWFPDYGRFVKHQWHPELSDLGLAKYFKEWFIKVSALLCGGIQRSKRCFDILDIC